jgi:hypothetical protein
MLKHLNYSDVKNYNLDQLKNLYKNEKSNFNDQNQIIENYN